MLKDIAKRHRDIATAPAVPGQVSRPLLRFEELLDETWIIHRPHLGPVRVRVDKGNCGSSFLSSQGATSGKCLKGVEASNVSVRSDVFLMLFAPHRPVFDAYRVRKRSGSGSSGPSWPRRKALSAPCSRGSVERALVALAASARRYAEVRRCGAFRNTQRGGLGEHGFAPLIDIGVC